MLKKPSENPFNKKRIENLNLKTRGTQVVIQENNDNAKSFNSKGFSEQDSIARKINDSTTYETCTEQLRAIGWLLGLIKFFDLIKLEKVFEHLYIKPNRKAKLGNYRYGCRYFDAV